MRDLRDRSAALPPGARVVLLGSVATAKYLEPIADVLGDRLCFPRDFVGRGDMSRGALLLQRVDAEPRARLRAVRQRRGPARSSRAWRRHTETFETRPVMPDPSPHQEQHPRDAQPEDLDALAALWDEGWHDAHAQIIPIELVRLRTLDSFRDRLRAALAETRVVGPRGAPAGFTILKDDEIYQFYVGRSARGSGLAVVLMADAEQRLAGRGVATAWLACAIGNERAARFYEKQRWRRAGNVAYAAETSQGTIMLEVWRYEKVLGR